MGSICEGLWKVGRSLGSSEEWTSGLVLLNNSNNRYGYRRNDNAIMRSATGTVPFTELPLCAGCHPVYFFHVTV